MAILPEDYGFILRTNRDRLISTHVDLSSTCVAYMISVRSSKDYVSRSDLCRMATCVFSEADRNIGRLLHDEMVVGHVACYTSASCQPLHLVCLLNGT